MARVSVGRRSLGDRRTAPDLQTFSPGSSQDTTVTFTNTTGAAVAGVELSLAVPARWKAVVRGTVIV